jgi:hypothetical protein
MHGEDEDAVAVYPEGWESVGPRCRICYRALGRALCIDSAHVACVDLHRCLSTLASNIRDAAIGCAGFALGQRAPLGVNRDAWRPNTQGKAAP